MAGKMRIEGEIKNVADNAYNELTDRIQRLGVMQGDMPHFSSTVLGRAEKIGDLARAVDCLIGAVAAIGE